MQKDDYIHKAATIIRTLKYATIATASKSGKPWNTPVACLYDNGCTLCWFSDKESQHSINIRENEDVFNTVYDSTALDGEGEGVYIEAKAVELTKPDEIATVRRISKGQDYQSEPGEFLGDAVRRAYKAVPQNVWVNDAEIKDGVFVRDYRVAVSIEDIKALNVNHVAA